MLFRNCRCDRWLIVSLIILSFSLKICPAVHAAALKEYSARQVVIHDGKEEPAGNLYVAKDKFRMERSGANMPENAVVIIRQDKLLSWTLFPDQKKYHESVLTKEDMAKSYTIPGGPESNVIVKEENLGTETISGYQCEKKRIETTTEMMGHKMTSKSLVWTTAELGFPIRTEAENGTITELRDIKVGSQDAGLFEIPAGYAKVASIMEVMGNRTKSQPERGQQTGMPKPGAMPEMPAEMRKMIEEQMGKGR